MITMYPGFIVANADNDFSIKEKELLADTLKCVTGENWVKTCDMFCELSFLAMQGKEEWEDDFLTCLAESIAENDNPAINDTILQSMLSVAESEDGISDIESQTIQYLREKLKV